MANWAEYMLFGSDVFVHLLCAIFCAWAGGRNGWHVCHAVSPEEAEPAGKTPRFYRSSHPSHLHICSALAYRCFLLTVGSHFWSHFCPYLFTPKIWPLSSPLLPPWFQPSLLFFGEQKTLACGPPHTILMILKSPNSFLNTVARLTLSSEKFDSSRLERDLKVKGCTLFWRQISPISLSVLFCRGCLASD